MSNEITQEMPIVAARMTRRAFGITAGTGLVYLAGAEGIASAQTAGRDPSLLTTTLTPVGAERAGNAAGTIPAWTGGMTEIPANSGWDPTKTLPPDFFASDAMLYEVNASNMAQYAHLISDGVQKIIQKQGFSLKVYPTRRTAALPQWCYDNIAKNCVNGKLFPNGGRFGFMGTYGGIPFPIPDVNVPFDAGAQIIWNSQARWSGSYFSENASAYVVSSGQLVLTQTFFSNYKFEYYQLNGTPETWNGFLWKVYFTQVAPPAIDGNRAINYTSAASVAQPNQTWQLLNGQGRVRKDPEVGYDIPSSYTNGTVNEDEYFGFAGGMDRYDWKFLGKQEMLIPYNNNQVGHTPAVAAHGAKFVDPNIVRWELHRVWVVEATLHPGERNVLPHRKFFVDEDTWIVSIGDSYDASGVLFKVGMVVNMVYPTLPGTILFNTFAYNLETGDYTTIAGSWKETSGAYSFAPVPDSSFEPQEMAASSSY